MLILVTSSLRMLVWGIQLVLLMYSDIIANLYYEYGQRYDSIMYYKPRCKDQLLSMFISWPITIFALMLLALTLLNVRDSSLLNSSWISPELQEELYEGTWTVEQEYMPIRGITELSGECRTWHFSGAVWFGWTKVGRIFVRWDEGIDDFTHG